MSTGNRLDLDNPQSFDEKLHWLNLYWQHPLKMRCGDKYDMRDYVKEHGLGYILPELFGVYENSCQIDFNNLPQRFVLKCTHGSGFNIVCLDKRSVNVVEVCRKLDAWMKMDYSKVEGEVYYAQIKHRIICEEYLDDLTNELPIDYKIFCFDGKAYCTVACTGRTINGVAKHYIFYDREWKNKLPFDKTSIQINVSIPRPEAYEEMIEAAEKLSRPFPCVRMDFYSIKGKAILGEMTFTSSGCTHHTLTDIAQQKLGELLRLPERLK